MFEGLQEDQLKGAIEAMLFVTDEPVGTIALAEMLECEAGTVEAALVELRGDLERDGRGIQLREVAGGWRLFTHPAYHELIERYVLSWDTRKLSGAAMETLAIVAYTQPVTRAGVASVRGVNSDSSINSLVEKGLVREMGTSDAPGNPVLYGTTRGFLEKFGLRSPADLPDLADFAPDEETRRLIVERLSATRADASVSDEQARDMARELLGEGTLDGDELDVDAGAGVEGHAGLLGDECATRGAVSDEAAEGDAAGARAGEGQEAPARQSAEAMFAEAIASTLGVVDKIDFDSLTFETDDE